MNNNKDGLDTSKDTNTLDGNLNISVPATDSLKWIFLQLNEDHWRKIWNMFEVKMHNRKVVRVKTNFDYGCKMSTDLEFHVLDVEIKRMLIYGAWSGYVYLYLLVKVIKDYGREKL